MPPLAAQQQNTKEYLAFRAFQTMDTQSIREALPPERLAWCENLQIVGPNNLIACNGPSAPIHNILGETILSQFSSNYNNTDFIICFAQSGAGYQVNALTGATVQIAPPNTFSTAPDMTTWQSQRILIADATAGYCEWDGSVFVKQGGISPQFVVTAGGSGYTSGATAAITGGSGSGATASVQVVAGVVVGLTLTAAGSGYLAGDTITVTISPVAGGTGATATGKVWPFLAFTPTTLAVFSARVWLAGGRNLQWTGTKGFDDVAAADAAGSSQISDADLVHSITALRALNNFLYIFGDNSIKQIGTITVSGSTTIFNIVTLSSDQGTTFPRAITSYNRLILFANKVGVYAVLGASVEKVSDPMDGIFALIDFTQPLQAAVQDLHTSLHTFLLLVRYKDPAKGTRSLILCFYKNRWFVANQGSAVTSICTAPIGGIIETFSSSGTDVTQIFQSSNPVPVILQTALTDNNQPHIGKRAIQAAVALSTSQFVPVNFTVDSENGSMAFPFNAGNQVIWINGAGQVVTWQNQLSQTVTWFGTGFIYQRSKASGSGVFLGASITGSFAAGVGNQGGFTINQIILEYQDGKVMGSRTGA